MRKKILIMLVFLVFSSIAHAENVQEAPRSQPNQIEEKKVTQPDTAQEESGLSDDFLREEIIGLFSESGFVGIIIVLLLLVVEHQPQQ